ncbi:hypothetical protein [Streptomyces sp. NPDC050485]|uniref:hypothetical protein n=1 Tax=Streptomyces sp. NPDC050485 TaxID=3365617 RepID=UPI00378E1A56
MSSTLESIATGSAVGSLLPLLTAIVQRPAWSAATKKVVATLVALVGGVITVVSVDGLDLFEHGLPTLGTLAAVLAASQTTYDLLWKPSKIAPAIESVTSPTGQGEAG